MIANLKEVARATMGKYWLNPGDAKVYFFQTFEVKEDDTFTIITDQRRFTKDYSEIGIFLKSFKPADPPALPPAAINASVLEQAGSLLDHRGDLDKVTGGLMEAFTRVQRDPQYVAQARIMNDIGKTVIEAYKTKVEGLKVVSELIRKKE